MTSEHVGEEEGGSLQLYEVASPVHVLTTLLKSPDFVELTGFKCRETALSLPQGFRGL
ncbi:hypothetical protein GBAR_LOCUS31852 [Geodia barretti]|uniref:Uncharacterized protein n=1 Tax=Geodia barretti TaxID=519541 RepID=A0AA35U416_GEOBA|nr:hypothetical protein GBAR_LOCUS31852 [Geodia barretti]